MVAEPGEIPVHSKFHEHVHCTCTQYYLKTVLVKSTFSSIMRNGNSSVKIQLVDLPTVAGLKKTDGMTPIASAPIS